MEGFVASPTNLEAARREALEMYQLLQAARLIAVGANQSYQATVRVEAFDRHLASSLDRVLALYAAEIATERGDEDAPKAEHDAEPIDDPMEAF